MNRQERRLVEKQHKKANLPCDECKGQCCVYPAMSQKEFDAIKLKYSLNPESDVSDFGNGEMIVVGMPNTGVCPWLKDGRCSVYELRPMSCRDYGIVPSLPCQYLYPKKAEKQIENFINKIRIIK